MWKAWYRRLNDNLRYNYGIHVNDKRVLVQMITSYIHYYNTKRIQCGPGVLVPMEKHALCLAA